MTVQLAPSGTSSEAMVNDAKALAPMPLPPHSWTDAVGR